METNQEILHAAYRAWMGCSNLRARRARCKRFTYGDQWADTDAATRLTSTRHSCYRGKPVF